MRIVPAILALLLAQESFASCYNIIDATHSCRYPQGDDWCKSKNRPPYAYKDKDCHQSHPRDDARLSDQAAPPEPTGANWPDVCSELESNHYATFSDLGPGKRNRGYVCFVVRDNPKLQGVLTLKHISGVGDWNLLIGTHFDTEKRIMSGDIGYSNNSGTTNELAWLPSQNTYFLVVAYPTSDTPSDGCLIYHQFDTSEILGQAVVMATAQWALVQLLSPDNASQEYSNNAGRVVAAGLSSLNRNNLALVGYDMALNEVSTQLANTFGGGSWMFTAGTNYFGGYLEQSGKYLFNPSVRCGN